MALTPQNDNNQVNAPKHIDNRVGKIAMFAGAARTTAFASISEALNSDKMTMELRYPGMTQLVIVDGVQREYWLKEGIEDVNFILKGFEESDIPLPTPSNESFIII